MNRGIQRKIPCQPILQVHPHPNLVCRALSHVQAGRPVCSHAGYIRQQVEMERRRDVVYPLHCSPAGDLQQLFPGHHNPFISFLFPADIAAEIDPPFIGAVFPRGEAECVVWNFELGRPPIAEMPGRDTPYSIPGDVVGVSILRENAVRLHTRHIGGKDERGLAVVVGVDHDGEPVGFRCPVAPRKLLDDLFRL